MKHKLFNKMVAFVAGALSCSAVLAQNTDYPSRAVNLIVGYSAGGATDRVARIIAQELTEQTGQPFIVENKPGANSNIAAAYAAGQEPNGYSLFVGSVANTISRSLYTNLQYDLLEDLDPIVLLTTISNILVVNPKLPVNSVQEYIAYAEANPGKLTCASSGVGSSIHLSCELFKMSTGTDILHIPYKGSSPAVNDLIGGQVDSMFDNLPSSLPQIKAGKLKALAVTADTEVPFAPGVPTVSESGVEGFAVTSWFGFYAPAGTPESVITKLNAEVNEALKSPAVIKAYQEAGFMMPKPPNSPADLAKQTQVEVDKWQAVIEKANLQMK
ncbi:MAG: tripartite tricarboxylate transporter substrate binding protein [Orrella sp.]